MTIAGAGTLTRPVQERTLWRDAMRRFLRNRLATLGLAIVGLFILTALFAPLLAPTRYDYAVLSEALQFPTARHWLGTDAVGRDFLSRLIYGARTSLLVGFAVQGIAFGVGLPLGALAGLRGGKVDFVIMRLVEVMTAFPGFLFAVFMMSVIGTGLPNVILAIGVTSWIEVCRLTRAQLLALREREFVLAARACGADERHILIRHLLPGALPSLVIMLALGIPSAIFAEAGLSFLGVGINDPMPSWGKMVGESLGYIRVYWHLGLYPTLAIALAMLSFNFMGDGLRDALDPTMVNA
jgi:ABC-type dipeptide/oligopeptide/nickel transport system permease subunit